MFKRIRGVRLLAEPAGLLDALPEPSTRGRCRTAWEAAGGSGSSPAAAGAERGLGAACGSGSWPRTRLSSASVPS